MATDTVPAAVPGPPDPPAQAPINTTPADPPKGFLAAMMAPVEPARPAAFDIVPTDGTSDATAGPDGILDRSAPGVSSASFRGAAEDAAKANDPTGARAKKSIWKELWLAAATRWAKGGGATNKRLDLAKARAQAKAHQVKENRTTTVAKSGGLPVRNTGGSGSGNSKGPNKSGSNSAGNNTNGAGRGGSGGGRGNAGGRGKSPAGSGSSGPGSSGGTGRGPSASGRGKDTRPSPKDAKGNHPAGGSGRGPGGGTGKDTKPSGRSDGNSSGSSWSTDGKNGQGLAPTGSAKGAGKPDSKGGGHSPAGKGPGVRPGAGGGAGKSGAAGKDGAPGKPGTSTKDAKDASRKADLTKPPKGPKNSNGKAPAAPAKKGQHPSGQPKTSLEKARETGHGDGTTARRAVDHVKAYVDGTRDGWHDEKTKNAKEHDRLDKAHDTHKPNNDGPQPVIVTEKEDDGVTTDVKPLTVQTIDANTLTLGTAGARTTVGRRELRNFKQYERKLEAKETVLQKIAEACTQLHKEAENESRECQDLAEQAKSVKGGEKLVATLNRLAEAAKNQATEAAELAKRAARAAEICKVVLTNIQTRYAPLYKAVVDSDETKPAELRFYNDKGSYAPAA